MSYSENCKLKMIGCIHGIEVDNETCQCDWGWYTNCSDSITETIYCDVSGKDIWGDSWKACLIIYSILYLLLLLISCQKLLSALYSDKVAGIKRLVYRLFRSPKNLSLFFLIIISCLRVFWLLCDPFQFDSRQYFSRLAERVIYELVYPFIYGLYANILLVWGGLYQGMQSKRTDPFKILRKLILAVMVLAFPLSITISVMRGMRIEKSMWQPVAYSLVVFGVTLMFVSFVIFGILLFIYVEKNGKDQAKIPESHTLVEHQEPKIINTENHSIERNELRRMTYTKVYLGTDEKFDYSWNHFESIDSDKEEIQEKFIFKEQDPKKLDKQSSMVINLITEDDKKIFRKLGILFTISVMFGMLALGFFAYLQSGESRSASPEEGITILYIVFFIEVLACYIIFMVFTRHIKVKDKNSLRFFTEISLGMSSKIPNLKFPKRFNVIGTRLHNFYS